MESRDIMALVFAITRLREALKIYGDKNAWIQHEGRWYFITDTSTSGEEKKPWDIARQALEKGVE